MPDTKNSAQKWRKSPTTCDLRATLNGMEHRYRFDSDVLAERLTRQTLFRINALFMAAYNEILELDACFKD
jgi:hypothetical protein